jgi:hypothetical protein
LTPVKREIEASLDTAAEVPNGISLTVDEIDNARTDTSTPSASDKTQAGATSEGFLSKITFAGDEDHHRNCRALCLKYADKFSDTNAPLPATLTPIEIMVDKAKWETPQTRGPVLSQSAMKVEIDRTMNRIIERSNALHYSHPVIVQRTSNTFRLRINCPYLDDCSDPASLSFRTHWFY